MRFIKYFLLFTLLTIFQAQSVYADLLITPTRVFFGERDRFAEVTLVNVGDKAKTYEMSWRFFKMKEIGPSYTPVSGAITEFDLSKHIVFTPRRVTLQPNAKQKIKLALRRPEEPIPPGDYHIHLGFASLPDPVEQESDNNGRPHAMVTINVGYTIPVILRSGPEDVTAKIGRIDIERNQSSGNLKVIVPVSREGGPYSILGHLFVYHIENGREEVVGELSNAHIFPEVNKRIFEVALAKEISGGSLKVVVMHYDLEQPRIYAEETFPLN
ncbi:MAG: DUF916 domain-containing protein [Alphaproteobacteria bacterium]|nr:DUF916 domain-containing protein [Alphaproteobacteria bacterium]